MSIWNDIRKRGIGSEQKKEDQNPNEENLWGSMSPVEILKKRQIDLEDKMADFRRELKKFRWNLECTKRN